MDISGRREGSALSGIGYPFQNFFISHDNLYCGSIFWERIVLSEGSRLITIKSSRLQALVLLLGSFAGNVVQISEQSLCFEMKWNEIHVFLWVSSLREYNWFQLFFQMDCK